MHLFITIATMIATDPVTTTGLAQLEEITNPILAILILVLFAGVYIIYKDSKNKDIYIKELNASMLENAVKTLDVLTSLKNSIHLDDAAHKALEEVIRENNNLLKTIIRDIDRLK